MIRKVATMLGAAALVVAAAVHSPAVIGEAGPSPDDPSREDLTRVEYPSLKGVPWEGRFIRPSDSAESLFGKDWETVARFNRVDRRHIYPGMTLKVPKDMVAARTYTPMPRFYEPARRHEKYILVSLAEQWLGAYEHGKLVFSFPAATGKDSTPSPTGVFRVDARHRTHTSSLYKTDNEEEQYPMDDAIRFHIGPDNVSYWIHSRDLPGKPASHGCIGVYNEEMQNRVYGFPPHPALLDAQRLYQWAVGEDDYEDDTGELEELEDGPIVEVIGENPKYRLN